MDDTHPADTPAARWATFLRERRKTLNLLQIPLAKALGVTQATVSRWEQGEIPPARYHAQLIDLLEITPEELHALYRGEAERAGAA